MEALSFIVRCITSFVLGFLIGQGVVWLIKRRRKCASCGKRGVIANTCHECWNKFLHEGLEEISK